MLIRKPSYFDTFRCIASACPDSCCQEWDVLVDPDKAKFYRALPGELGDLLRQVLKEEDGDTYLTIEDRRCPMWRADGLCRIQAELGEAALCKTCREFPRLTHDYGDFIEYGLELSCPEAARIILSSPVPSFKSQEVPGGDEPEYDTEIMEILLNSRENLHKILSDPTRPANEVLALMLMYGYHVQAELDGSEISEFDPQAALLEACEFAANADTEPFLNFFKNLEILTEHWEDRLGSPSPAPWSAEHLLLARYFADRYWLQAVSDFDLICRVKLAIISCIAIRTLGGKLIPTAQLYSKEIENSIDNIESILDAAYTQPAFTDSNLLGLLLIP